MSARRRLNQMSANRDTPATSGAPAKYAAFMAPTDEPTTKSGRSPASSRTCSMPTWMAPRLPPPAKTKAVLFSACGFALLPCSMASSCRKASPPALRQRLGSARTGQHPRRACFQSLQAASGADALRRRRPGNCAFLAEGERRDISRDISSHGKFL